MRIEIGDIKSTDISCIMDIKDSFKALHKQAILSVTKDYIVKDLPVSEYVEFLGKCKLPVKYVEEESKFIWEPSDYINTGHFMASYTAVRYCVVTGYLSDLHAVPMGALEILKTLNLSPLESLKLAHYKYVEHNDDSLHTLFADVSTVVDSDRFMKQLKHYNSCNEGFQGDPIDMDWKSIYELIQDDEKKALTILNIKSNE